MSGLAADLARRLARDAEAVCRRFLSNGRREGRYWLVGDVHNTKGRSLYVRLVGPEQGPGAAGKWADAATGEHGDLLDLIRLHGGYDRLGDAMREAAGFLALPQPRREPAPRTPARRGSSEAARRLFAMGRPITATLAEAYLHGRGIDIRHADQPLRFHPACYCIGDNGCFLPPRPALLAAVTDLSGTITGVHRTWLDPATADKAAVPTPRKAMGLLLGHGVRFGAPHDVWLAGEGLETVLSLKTVMPAMPMVAALSAAHLGALIVPASVERLYVACDLDPAGWRALERLKAREDLCQTQCLAIMPMHGDFNDDLRREGAEKLRRHLKHQLLDEDVIRFLS